MSDVVPDGKIEQIVGAKRHVLRHLGRAVNAEQKVYILHSSRCKATTPDLRDCSYSRVLDEGIDVRDWEGWEDRAVVLGLARGGLVPLRLAEEMGR